MLVLVKERKKLLGGGDRRPGATVKVQSSTEYFQVWMKRRSKLTCYLTYSLLLTFFRCCSVLNNVQFYLAKFGISYLSLEKIHSHFNRVKFLQKRPN